MLSVSKELMEFRKLLKDILAELQKIVVLQREQTSLLRQCEWDRARFGGKHCTHVGDEELEQDGD